MYQSHFAPTPPQRTGGIMPFGASHHHHQQHHLQTVPDPPWTTTTDRTYLPQYQQQQHQPTLTHQQQHQHQSMSTQQQQHRYRNQLEHRPFSDPGAIAATAPPSHQQHRLLPQQSLSPSCSEPDSERTRMSPINLAGLTGAYGVQ
jgi:hypothetical protein